MKCSVELESAILQRVTGLKKTAKMWGSPEELEAVAMHFTHVVLSARTAAVCSASERETKKTQPQFAAERGKKV